MSVGVSETMRAIRMHAFGGPEVLRAERVPVPEPGVGQVRVRVHAAGVNPFEWKLREGRMRGRLDVTLPFIPGFDIAGVIDEAGAQVQGWKAGDAVIAALHRSPQGGYAEYAIARIEDLIGKPGSLSFEQAAGVPTPATAAWRFLIEAAKLQSGQRVLIHGAAGGVGSAAVQIAKARGAHVIATASAYNHDYLQSLGADQIVNYRVDAFERYLGKVDIVLDNVGGEAQRRIPQAMRPGAIFLSPAGLLAQSACDSAGVNCPPPPAPGVPFGPTLLEIATLIEAGRFRVDLDKIFALEEASIAQELNAQGHTRGKIVLKVL